MSSTILVTGAAGFIGSHTTATLLTRGTTVVGLDNLNDYYDPARKQSNLVEIGQHPGFHFVAGDIQDRALVGQLFRDHRFDAVVHLAAMPGVRASMDNPHLYYDVNLVGTLNLLDAARDAKVPNFVFASTSSVYGSTTQIPFVETDACDRPLAPYPASKRSAEMLGYTYNHLYGQNFTALRFFTVYGPRNRPDMMAFKLLDNVMFNKAVPLFNDGQMYRDWTVVEDIVSGIIAAADRPLGYEVINLGRGEPILVADFVGVIEELTGRKAQLTPAPMQESDMASTYADITKARALLDYNPQYSVRSGVERLWQWYQAAILNEALTSSAAK